MRRDGTGTELLLLASLPGLKEISVHIGGLGAKESNRRAAESALRDMADMHPRDPVANIKVDDNRWIFDEPEEEDDGNTEQTE